MEHVFIVNPVAGKADARNFLLPELERAKQALGAEATVECTTRPGEARDIARRWAQTGAPVRLYACGGDGTLNEVFAGALGFANAQVASVPCGSGNDFIRTFGQSARFLDIAAQMTGRAVPVDLIEANGGVCAAICSVGVDSEVAYGIPKFRRLPFCGGSMAYQLSIALRVLRPLAKHLRVTVDGRTFEGDYVIATVCNGKSYGGGYFAAPEASVTDGLLDVVLVKKVSRLRIAGVVGIYKNGEHVRNGEIREDLRSIIRLVRTRAVAITALDERPLILNIDGECGPGRQLQASVLPGAARFVVPAGAVMHNACTAPV